MKTIFDIIYDENYPYDCVMDVFTNDTCDSENLFLYFHGGGIEGGSKNDTRDFCRYLFDLNNDISIVTADYRMYPDAKFPEFIDDCSVAVKWLMSEKNDKVRFKKLYIGGSSAGAYLSMMLCFDKNYLEKHGINSLRDVAGYIFDAGQPTAHFNVLYERGLDSRLVRVDEAAPLYFIDSEFEKTLSDILVVPKFLFFVADNDMENRLEQNLLLMRTMRHFGLNADKIEYHLMNGFGHCGYTGNPEFSRIICDFIDR